MADEREMAGLRRKLVEVADMELEVARLSEKRDAVRAEFIQACEDLDKTEVTGSWGGVDLRARIVDRSDKTVDKEALILFVRGGEKSQFMKFAPTATDIEKAVKEGRVRPEVGAFVQTGNKKKQIQIEGLGDEVERIIEEERTGLPFLMGK